jgi:MFS family permease
LGYCCQPLRLPNIRVERIVTALDDHVNIVENPAVVPGRTTRRAAYWSCLIVGWGGLFAGATGPLLSAFVPPLVQDALGDHRTAIGAVMAIDNVLLLLLVPLAGIWSDRAVALGRGRLPLVLLGYILAAGGMAMFPMSARAGITGVIAAMVVLYTGINLQRSPFQALVADSTPSAYRSVANGSVTFHMCLGAIVFLMLGRILGMQAAFLAAAGTVLAIGGAFALWLREPRAAETPATEATYAALVGAVRSAIGGAIPGLRPIFVSTLLLQLTFQTFTTWYALYGIERFGVAREEVTIGFIAWAVGALIGALPGGFIGRRIGRRNTVVLGFASMSICLLALHGVADMSRATPLIALASACWALPMANAYPLFVEPIPRHQRGVLSAMFLLCMAGGAIGDPLNGALFDLFGSYRPLFVMMAVYTSLALLAILYLPRGVGEADTGQ